MHTATGSHFPLFSLSFQASWAVGKLGSFLFFIFPNLFFIWSREVSFNSWFFCSGRTWVMHYFRPKGCIYERVMDCKAYNSLKMVVYSPWGHPRSHGNWDPCVCPQAPTKTETLSTHDTSCSCYMIELSTYSLLYCSTRVCLLHYFVGQQQLSRQNIWVVYSHLYFFWMSS